MDQLSEQEEHDELSDNETMSTADDTLPNITAPRSRRGRGILAAAPTRSTRGHRGRGIGLRGTVGG